MSGIYWCSIFATLGLIFCLSSGQAQDASDNTQRQADQKQTPTQTLPIPVPVEIIENQTDTDARQRSEAEAAQREKDDLVAQQGMNAATQAMNEATQRMASDSREMTVATWVGVALLFVTLMLTLQANRAAVKAVEVTDRIGKAQSRAYLVFEIDGEPLSIDIDDPAMLAVDFKVTNVGQTPANNVRHLSGIVIRDVSDTFAGDRFAPDPDQTIPDASIGPGKFIHSTATNTNPFDPIKYRAAFFPESTVRVFIAGRIFYDDVFGDEHQTSFCYFLDSFHEISDRERISGLSKWHQHNRNNFAT